jgi:hypothetical protein
MIYKAYKKSTEEFVRRHDRSENRRNSTDAAPRIRGVSRQVRGSQNPVSIESGLPAADGAEAFDDVDRLIENHGLIGGDPRDIGVLGAVADNDESGSSTRINCLGTVQLPI